MRLFCLSTAVFICVTLSAGAQAQVPNHPPTGLNMGPLHPFLERMNLRVGELLLGSPDQYARNGAKRDQQRSKGSGEAAHGERMEDRNQAPKPVPVMPLSKPFFAPFRK